MLNMTDNTSSRVGNGYVFGIAEVEAMTRVPRATLRIWERRYGFPLPARSEAQLRLYSLQDIEKIELVRDAMAVGWRAGDACHSSAENLRRRLLDKAEKAESDLTNTGISALLQKGSARLVDDFLLHSIAMQGIREFVCKQLPLLNTEVGSAWRSGQIGIFEEHMYTERIKKLMQLKVQEFRSTQRHSGNRAILTTPSGENHTLGLLMVEVLLEMSGVRCLNLGASMPAKDIADAADKFKATLIGLSISIHRPFVGVRREIQKLRGMVPTSVGIWIGGDGSSRHVGEMGGVKIFTHIHEIESAVAAICASSIEAEPLPTVSTS